MPSDLNWAIGVILGFFGYLEDMIMNQYPLLLIPVGVFVIGGVIALVKRIL